MTSLYVIRMLDEKVPPGGAKGAKANPEETMEGF